MDKLAGKSDIGASAGAHFEAARIAVPEGDLVPFCRAPFIPDLHTLHTTFSDYSMEKHKGLSNSRILAVDENSKRGLAFSGCSTSIFPIPAQNRGGTPDKAECVVVHCDSDEQAPGWTLQGSAAIGGGHGAVWTNPAKTGGRTGTWRPSITEPETASVLGSIELGLRPLVLASGRLLRPQHIELGAVQCA